MCSAAVRAIRYRIGSGRDGFTWSGVQSVTKKAEWPDWTPPRRWIARQPYLLPLHGRRPRPTRSAHARCISRHRVIAFTHQRAGHDRTAHLLWCIPSPRGRHRSLFAVNVRHQVIVLPMIARADNIGRQARLTGQLLLKQNGAAFRAIFVSAGNESLRRNC